MPNLSEMYRRQRADVEDSIAKRIQRSVARHEAADTRTPIEKLADAVDRPAGPPSTNPTFNDAIRRLAQGDDE